MDKSEYGPHIGHCCFKHSYCKYGDDDCPVVDGTVKQRRPCEHCYIEEEQGEECRCSEYEPVLKEICRMCANPLTETMGKERKDLLRGIDKIWEMAREVLPKD